MSKTDLTIYKWIKSTNYTLKIVKKYIEKVVCNADDRHYLIHRKHLQIDNKKTIHRWRSKEYEKNSTERASPNGQWNYEILNSLIVKYRLKSQWGWRKIVKSAGTKRQTLSSPVRRLCANGRTMQSNLAGAGKAEATNSVRPASPLLFKHSEALTQE